MVLGSGIRDPRSGIRKKPIPDPGSRGQKAPDPWSRILIRNTGAYPDHPFRLTFSISVGHFCPPGSGSETQQNTGHKKKIPVLRCWMLKFSFRPPKPGFSSGSAIWIPIHDSTESLDTLRDSRNPQDYRERQRFILFLHGCTQGVNKRCRLSWLTNSALVYGMHPNAGRGRLRGLSQ